MKNVSGERTIIVDGRHAQEALNVLGVDLAKESLEAIRSRAARVVELSVNPNAGPPLQPSDGLLYGLIQSGKTSVMTVAAAMAADNGFDCVIVLTSDIDLLYDQTLDRVRNALRGLSVLGKNDWKDSARFSRQIRTKPFAIVGSKNSSKLNSLYNAFRAAKAKGLSLFLIDDEADQASLNTKEQSVSKKKKVAKPISAVERVSSVNKVITELRDYFATNTYLQVTATPQALFLQRPDHRYHPSFTVLTEPGPGYVGGDEFFGSERLLEYVDLMEVNHLTATNQPAPTGTVPRGLKTALYTFLVGACAKIKERPQEGFAFLCHVSVSNKDHAHIVSLLDRFKEDTISTLQKRDTQKHKALLRDLDAAYSGLAKTEANLPPFEEVLDTIDFYIRGANIKLINVTSSDEIKLDGALNLFVGGNKLGRGVTVKNLLVSYYGRNPKKPNTDTVLQHARMYGYRQRDLGVTRLFLPEELADHFRSIHQMEDALRKLVLRYPGGRFQGIYVGSPMQATRRNVLDPDWIGAYVAGQSYNPAYPLRTAEIRSNTRWLDEQFVEIKDDAPYLEVAFDRIMELLQKCIPDPSLPSRLWNLTTFQASLDALKSILKSDRAYLVIRRRDRGLTQPRRENQGILSGGEDELAPTDKPTLFLFRQNATATGDLEVWWPQLRFPEGNYVIAFNLGK